MVQKSWVKKEGTLPVTVLRFRNILVLFYGCFNTPTQLRLSCGNSDDAALEPRPGKSPEENEGPHPGSAAVNLHWLW